MAKPVYVICEQQSLILSLAGITPIVVISRIPDAS